MKKMRILAVALAMVTAFAMSASAADWNFYGNARIATFVTDNDTTNDTDFSENLHGNSRIGAKVKVGDELSGRFEYGTADGNANIRLLYGAWNFGAGSLIVGQDYAPAWHSISNQVYAGDNGLGGWGENYTDRTPQIKLVFGNFKLAFLEPNTGVYGAGGTGSKLLADIASTDAQYAGWMANFGTEVEMPAVQAKYALKYNNLDLALSGAYQTFDVNSATKTDNVDSYMVAAKFGIAFGAATLKASVFSGQNVGNIAVVDVAGGKGRKGYAIFDGTNDVIDVDAMGYALVAGYTINDMISLEAGVGYAEMEEDVDNSKEDDVVSYYIQAPLTLAPGVVITPEIGVVDYKQDQDDTTYYGAKWQINF